MTSIDELFLGISWENSRIQWDFSIFCARKMVIYLDEFDHDGERQGSHPHVGCRMTAIF
jgi:hypothetical protein